MKDHAESRTATHADLMAAALSGDFLKAALDAVHAAMPQGVTTLVIQTDRLRPDRCSVLQSGPGDLALMHACRQRYSHASLRSPGLPTRMRPLDDGPHGLSLDLGPDGRLQAHVELRLARADDRLMAAVRRALEPLIPDLRLGAGIAGLADRAETGLRLCERLLDRFPFPALVLESSGHVVHGNAAASELLARMVHMACGPDGRLHLFDPEAEARMAAALAASGAAGMTLSLQGAGGAPVILHLSRLAGGRAPAWLASLHDLGAPLHLSHDLLWQSLALTTNEAGFVAALVNGETVPEIATRRKMSKQTLRNQLSAILRKTGTTRQAELVGRLTRVALWL